MRAILWTSLLAVAVALTGCSGTSTPDKPRPTTYVQAPRTVRPDETPLRGKPVQDGDTQFTLIGYSAHLPSLVGSHAEIQAKGQYVRIRLVVVNLGRSGVLFDTRRQLLVLDDGSTHAPDGPTMIVKRQPDKFDLGAQVRVEFDLYYDVPKDAEPVALRAFGGPTLTDMKDKEGTDIRIR
jgi:Domain of unknown function (DUF4352)